MNETQAWLADCPSRVPQNQSERSEFPAILGPPAIPSIDCTERNEKAAAAFVSTFARLEAIPEQLAAKTEALAAVGGHVEKKIEKATQSLRQTQKELQPTLDALETNQARLEAMIDEYKLKENPRQTRQALLHHDVSRRIIDFIMEHLLAGKAVPKAPTAALQLQNKYATKDGLDRKTVHRHFQAALPILRAAGWSAHLLPASDVGGSKDASGAGSPPQDNRPEANPMTSDDVAKLDSSDTLTVIERLQQTEEGSEDLT